MHKDTKARHEVALASSAELFTTMEEAYSHVYSLEQTEQEIPTPQKLKVITERIHALES
jgi:hypothetical protein